MYAYHKAYMTDWLNRKAASCSKKKKTNDQLVKKYGSAAAEQKEQGKTRPSNA